DPDRAFACGTKLLKDSRSSTVAEIPIEIRGEARTLIFKRFRVPSRWDGVASWFRPTACLRSWLNGHGFLDCLLPSPRPLAMWHRHRVGMDWEGYLLVEKVESACDLHQLLALLASAHGAQRQLELRLIIDRLAFWVRELHTRGWSHRDLK